MKQKVFKKILGLSLILLTSLIPSCQDKIKICSSCEEKSEGQKLVVLPLSNEGISVNCTYYFGQSENNSSFEFGHSNLNNAEFGEIINSIVRLVNEELNPYVVVFYFNDFLSQDNDSSAGCIVGFSTYTYVDNKVTHRLYIKDNSNYKESVKDFAEVDAIYTNQLLYFLENSFSIPTFSKKSFISVKNVDIMKDVPTTKRNLLFLKQQYNYYKSFMKTTKAPEPCGPGCSGMRGICVATPTGYICKFPFEEICPTEGEITRLKNDTTVLDTLYKAYDTTLLHNFRDNFLSNYSVGQKYINYYYSLAEFLVDNIPLSLSIETAEATFKVNNCIEKLMNPTTYGNSIVIDETFANELITLFNKYKSMDSDLDYKMALDDLIYDVTRFKGLSVNEIRSKMT